MAELFAELGAIYRFVVRCIVLIILFGLISWPFGGPFHLLHAIVGFVIGIGAWLGFPGAAR